MADNLSGFGEAIRQAGEAYAETIATLTKALLGSGEKAAGTDRDRTIENWLRLARMSKDGMITALEQGFELWEREVRRMATSSSAEKPPANPFEAWSENWRKAMDAVSGSAGNEEFRKQAEAVRSRFAEGMRAWQSLWEREK